VTTDGAVDLLRNAMIAAAKVGGPFLLVALIVGLLVGVMQAATQVNEASVTYVTKLLAVGAAITVLGSWTLNQLVDYTSRTLGSIANVIR
jgi:flagellar biosynthetic protein FliQ